MKAVTLKDIALQCGVAKTTVAQALGHNDVGLAATTVARIRAAAQQMGYNPAYHESARRLALRKTGTQPLNHLVALCFPTDFIAYAFYNGIFNGVLTALGRAGFGVCVGHLEEEARSGAPRLAFMRVISRGDIDGIILPTSLGGSTAFLAQLRRDHGFGDRPIISVIDRTDGITSVVPDYQDGYYQSARHLLALGHRHLLQVVFPYFSAPADDPINREEGTRRALREYGLDPAVHLHCLPFTPAWVNPLDAGINLPDAPITENEPNPDVRALIDYLRRHPEVTAILTLNDAYALHVWYTLTRAGYRIPDDISLVGFDDTDPMRDEHGNNLLTSVRMPLEEIGRRAVQMLLLHLDTPTPPQLLVLPTELIVRGSTVPASR